MAGCTYIISTGPFGFPHLGQCAALATAGDSFASPKPLLSSRLNLVQMNILQRYHVLPHGKHMNMWTTSSLWLYKCAEKND